MTIKVKSYHMNKVRGNMKIKYGQITPGKEDAYIEMLSSIEINMLLANWLNPSINGRRVEEAIKMALLTIEGYLGDVTYDFSHVMNEESEELLHIILDTFDPLTNQVIEEIVEEKYGSSNITILEEYYRIPVRALNYILDSVERHNDFGTEAYFNFINEMFGEAIEDVGYRIAVFIPEELRGEDEHISDNGYITMIEGKEPLLSSQEFITKVGYPINEYDVFVYEIVNIIGVLLEPIFSDAISEVIDGYIDKMIEFYELIKKTMPELIDKPYDLCGNEDLWLGIPEDMPVELEERSNLNGFYLLVISMLMNLTEELLEEIEVENNNEMLTLIGYSLMDFVVDSCLECEDENCIVNHSLSGYCKLCHIGDQPIPCPKKEEISYEVIKAVPSDMEE